METITEDCKWVQFRDDQTVGSPAPGTPHLEHSPASVTQGTSRERGQKYGKNQKVSVRRDDTKTAMRLPLLEMAADMRL